MIEPTPAPEPTPDPSSLPERLKAGEAVQVPTDIHDLASLMRLALRTPLVAAGSDSVRIDLQADPHTPSAVVLAGSLEAAERLLGRCVSVTLALDEGERTASAADKRRLESAQDGLIEHLGRILSYRFVVGRPSRV